MLCVVEHPDKHSSKMPLLVLLPLRFFLMRNCLVERNPFEFDPRLFAN